MMGVLGEVALAAWVGTAIGWLVWWHRSHGPDRTGGGE